MRFRMDQLLRSLSMGLDAVESELTGSTTNHGKRVEILTAAMGRSLGWNDDHVVSVAACALLHDNALTESMSVHKPRRGENTALSKDFLAAHCLQGERNASYLPFPAEAAGFITYHHEYMDGSGPFGKRADEMPEGAQLIAAADHFDIKFNIKEKPATALPDLREGVSLLKGIYYTPLAADALCGALDAQLLISMRDENINDAHKQAIPMWSVDLGNESLMRIAKTVAAITDYKSHFTAKHSLQIANRAYWMARYYGFDEDTLAKVYLAASLHDLGKLITPINILEKPGKLDKEEFRVIAEHVYWSHMMLKDIEGFGEICRWAVTHHRKLTGTGYPELPAKYLDLDFISRLMVCIDIYQAVREARPYHPSRTHRETIEIMRDMAGKGEIDRQITEDLAHEMERFTGDGGDVPPPEEQMA